jgi:hypothetical protein
MKLTCLSSKLKDWYKSKKWILKNLYFWLILISFSLYVFCEFKTDNSWKEVSTTLFSGLFLSLVIYFATVVVPERKRLINGLKLLLIQYKEMTNDIELKYPILNSIKLLESENKLELLLSPDEETPNKKLDPNKLLDEQRRFSTLIISHYKVFSSRLEVFLIAHSASEYKQKDAFIKRCFDFIRLTEEIAFGFNKVEHHALVWLNQRIKDDFENKNQNQMSDLISKVLSKVENG